MSNWTKHFLNCVVPKKADRDFIKSRVHVKATEFVDILNKHSKHIEQNNGFFSFDILESQKGSLYCQYSLKDEPKETVTSSQQMPDREAVAANDDLPF